nr:hypothetical protein [Tanacetum cinerariifolium]GEV91248.1 hypothetical protein [Tanacetum cinerariifolium]
MAITSSSSSSDKEVQSCSKACSKAYDQLHSQYDKLIVEFCKSQIDVLSYHAGLESVEARLVMYKQNESILQENINMLKNEVEARELSPAKPAQDISQTTRPMAPIIQDWVSNSEDESEPNDPQGVSSFVQTFEHVKSSRHSVQLVLAPILAATPKPTSPKTNCSSKRKNTKNCFVCRSMDHLIKDLLTKSKPVYVTAARPVSAAIPKIMVTRPRHAHSLNTKSKSTIRRHKTCSQSSKTSNSSPKVTAAKAQVVSTAKREKGKWIQVKLNGGYVAFGGNPKGGNISDFKLPDESQVLLKVPRENNMYNVNLKDIVPSRHLTCLFAKESINESNLWHRRRGHVNFKTINKLVKGNLVRGLPIKVYENNNTCVACKKGKQHKASCKAKPVSSVNQPLFRLHMDLFGPTFVKSLNKKNYCLVITDDYSRFTWVIFLATKDKTSPILKTFITGLENQLSLKQNGIAERKNWTLIEAVRTMLADSLLPIPFWAEAVNTACYVPNRVLVTKPHNKTPYELLHGRTPRKVDEGILVRYFVNNKAFRVFNSRTHIVQETLHVNFIENMPNIAGTGPTWLFDIDSLTRTMNYQPIIVGNQSNPSAIFQQEFHAGKAGEEATQQYMLFPVWSTGSLNPQNKEGDAAFDGKLHDAEKPGSDVNLSLVLELDGGCVQPLIVLAFLKLLSWKSSKLQRYFSLLFHS